MSILSDIEFGVCKIDVPRLRLTTDPAVDVKDTQKFVEVIIQQGRREVSIEEETIEKAAEEFTTRYGGELGIDKIAAIKLLGSADKKDGREQSGRRLTKYTVTIPDKAYSLTVR